MKIWSSYKQEGVIYNARDMAISSIEDVPIHLITSIPSLETFNIKIKKYKKQN